MSKDCLRSRWVSGACPSCGASMEPAHIPMREGGLYCAACCPCCNAPDAPGRVGEVSVMVGVQVGAGKGRAARRVPVPAQGEAKVRPERAG